MEKHAQSYLQCSMRNTGETGDIDTKNDNAKKCLDQRPLVHKVVKI